MNEFVVTINKNKEQIEACTNMIDSLKKGIVDAKKQIVLTEINGKSFRLRKSKKSKFYDLEFRVSINPETYDFYGTLTFHDKRLMSKYRSFGTEWKDTCFEISQRTGLDIIYMFVDMDHYVNSSNMFVSRDDVIPSYMIEELAEAWIDKRLVVL